MSVITENLPKPIRDLGVSIIGEKCYASLVENLDVGDIGCLKFAVSKGLGVGIVVGGSIVKLPQILVILKSRSARGLSLPGYVLETLSYGITLAYSARNQFPFSTYGENCFLTFQNAIITLLIIAYSSSTSKTMQFSVATAALVGAFATLQSIPLDRLSMLQMGTLPLSLFAKLPQIAQNAQNDSTGQLSAFAVVSQILGCVARLFTTSQEVGDKLVAAGFALALVLNLILGAQLWIYWGKSEAPAPVKVAARAVEPKTPEKVVEKASVSAYQATPQSATHRVATPPPRASTPSSGRKWARKVD
ncbi:hypothetical protein BDQ17DRAFT_1284532 [Cyathus striatus]|nr:hypothetical protein BDQ17DRAFT_1284532 [Cyathus striatus]